jgi:hypothetical protein
MSQLGSMAAFGAARRRTWSGLVAVSAFTLALAACASGRPYALEAAGPFLYPAEVGPAFNRLAILVTVVNHSGDDLQVNPSDFLARDAQQRVYPSNPAATIADARVAGHASALRGILPLAAVTLRTNDVLNGYIAFDVPAGVTPVELVWRQSDADAVAVLRPGR